MVLKFIGYTILRLKVAQLKRYCASVTLVLITNDLLLKSKCASDLKSRLCSCELSHSQCAFLRFTLCEYICVKMTVATSTYDCEKRLIRKYNEYSIEGYKNRNER